MDAGERLVDLFAEIVGDARGKPCASDASDVAFSIQSDHDGVRISVLGAIGSKGVDNTEVVVASSHAADH